MLNFIQIADWLDFRGTINTFITIMTQAIAEMAYCLVTWQNDRMFYGCYGKGVTWHLDAAISSNGY
jgi:hypothetical protein